MKPPNAQEFKSARLLAEWADEEGEEAYQVCRWYRGQMFLREKAEKALSRIREESHA
jgi:hypothetical protein